MTDAPSPPEAPETPAVKARKKRTRLQALAFFGGMGAAILAALLLVAGIGGRMYLLSDSGRGLVTSFVAGKKLGRYGRINVEGVRGDLFDDFTIDRVTVTDAEGVWLEARKVRVDWNWWPLVTRRFHATEVTADVIRLIRRPLVEPSTEPPGPQPLSIDIDRFSADVELLEGFSKEYGRWKLAGEAQVPRKGVKRVTVNADSNSRPGDFLRLTAAISDDIADMRLNLRAREARGGPIAGSLGYSPDQPFLATATVNGEIVDAVVRTGDFTPLSIKGTYGPDQTNIAGLIDFSGSDLLDPFARRIGRTARFALAIAPDRNDDGLQGVGWRLVAENLSSRASGLIRVSDRSIPDGVRVRVSTPSLSRLAGRPLGDAAAWSALFRGDAKAWSLDGSIDVLNADLSSYQAQRVRGPVDIRSRDGRYDIDGDLRVAGGSTAGMVGGLLGPSPRVQFEAARLVDGSILLERLDAEGQALTVTGTGGRNLLGGLGFRGRAEVTDASRLRKGASGAFGGTIAASMPRAGAPWQITFDGRGRGFALGVGELDRLLGAAPRLQLVGVLNDARVTVESARLTGAHGNVAARGFIEGDGGLRLAMNWNARGPIGVGPVEVDGDKTGNGTDGGTHARPSATP
ncbi:MAG: hypothetical protein K0M78_07925, partial [Brevundimonas sp.]|nr:hypothetical protein [Brevundimonas sp.]